MLAKLQTPLVSDLGHRPATYGARLPTHQRKPKLFMNHFTCPEAFRVSKVWPWRLI